MRSWLIVMLLIGSLAVLSLPTAAQRPHFTNDASRVILGPPPVGENAVLVGSGETVSFQCPAAPAGSGLLCAPQIAVDMPADATGYSFNVNANGDFIIFVRFGAEIGLVDGAPVLDFSVSSTNGTATVALPVIEPGADFPGLQEGRYFFALAHFENDEDQRYSITPNIQRLRTLSPNNTTEFTCSPDEFLMCNQQYRIDVTRETQLRFDIQGEGNFQAFVRRDALVEYPPISFNSDGAATIDDPRFDYVFASDPSNSASILIDATSSPPLQPGVYHLSVLNLTTFAQNFTVSASFDSQPTSQPPNAGFGFSPREPRVGDAVQFSDTSDAGTGSLTSWSWDFGDGQTSTAQNPTHTYAAPGTYRVSLLVFNDSELSDTVAQTITVLPQATTATTAVDADVAVLAFMELMLVNPDAWERVVQEGCVIYTNISGDVAVIQVVTLNGQTQAIDVAASDSVIVCGNAIHLNV